MEDAEAALKLLVPIPYRKSFEAAPDHEVRFRHTGHILGSASVEVKLHNRRVTRVLFSGDLGRWDRPILRDPVIPKKADVLILESTYGNRDHPTGSRKRSLARVIKHVGLQTGAVPVIIPAFAVGRTQEIVWRIRLLEDQGRIPVLPVYIDSPMAIDVTQIYRDHPEDHDLDMKQLKNDGKNPLRSKQFTIARSVEASKQIGELNGPFIVISASGMATGGRILHHLKRWLPEERATVLLCGFQAYGTRGRKLLEGAEDIRIFGKNITVHAKVEKINGLSAHADRTELQRWISELASPPKNTYLVHGEPEASKAFANILTQKNWKATVAEEGARMKLP